MEERSLFENVGSPDGDGMGAVPTVRQTEGRVAPSSGHYPLSRLSDELVLAAGLRKHGIRLFDGLKTFSERMNLARMGIKEFAIAGEMLGKRTLGEWFIKCYGEKV